MHFAMPPLVIVFTALTLLTGCSSGGSSNDATVTPVENTGGTGAPVNDASEVVGNTSGPESELVGSWQRCNDAGGLRVQYVFTATTYTYTVGTGTCAGFSDGGLVAAGIYTITGTELSDSGLTAYSMELDQQTLDGTTLPEIYRETQYRLVYTGVENQLSVSSVSYEGDELSLTLDLQSPYVRFR